MFGMEELATCPCPLSAQCNSDCRKIQNPLEPSVQRQMSNDCALAFDSTALGIQLERSNGYAPYESICLHDKA